ncbi:hypothetical protein T08_15215 [Trichinella sp. T8]|nr:hypothetical protein T08_15215 [Trichinella sp. T8]
MLNGNMYNLQNSIFTSSDMKQRDCGNPERLTNNILSAVLEEYFRTITADVILSAEGISCHSNPEAISYI